MSEIINFGETEIIIEEQMYCLQCKAFFLTVLFFRQKAQERNGHCQAETGKDTQDPQNGLLTHCMYMLCLLCHNLKLNSLMNNNTDQVQEQARRWKTLLKNDANIEVGTELKREQISKSPITNVTVHAMKGNVDTHGVYNG